MDGVMVLESRTLSEDAETQALQPAESRRHISHDGSARKVRSEWANGFGAAALALLLCSAAYGAWRLGQPTAGADPFLLFLAAVVAAAWFGEVTGAAVASGIAVAVLVTAPYSAAHLELGTRQYVEAVLYLAIGAAVGWPRFSARRAQSQLYRSWEITATITRGSQDGICAVDSRGTI